MLRFIIKEEFRDAHSGAQMVNFTTIDCDVPSLEDVLGRGGYGESGYSISELVGVEILREPNMEVRTDTQTGGGEHEPPF